MQRRTLAIVAAFLAVYLIWGSTYLAIRYAIESIPPFLMAGGRWIIAGGLLYAWRRAAGDPAPTLRHWRSASLVGIALVVGGNGIVSWSQQWVPSSLAALLIAIVPLWIALFAWASAGERPARQTLGGVLLGLVGVALLFGPGIARARSGDLATLIGALAIVLATVSWASGSLYSRKAALPSSTLLGAAMEMLVGGLVLTLVGLGAGEAPRVDLAAVSARSWLAFGFLVVFGSIVAYSAYVWLLRQVPASLVATYAFVNPVVAVLLGTLVAGEPFGVGTLVASVLIVAGVALVVTSAGRRPATPPPPRPNPGVPDART